MIPIIGFGMIQMILSAILGFIHGGVLGYFVAGINVISILALTAGFGYCANDILKKVKKEKPEKETDIHESGMD